MLLPPTALFRKSSYVGCVKKPVAVPRDSEYVSWYVWTRIQKDMEHANYSV